MTRPKRDLLRLRVEVLVATGHSAAERLAVYRAAMTVIIELMDQADDSLADLGDAFLEIEKAYLDLVPKFLEEPAVLKDLLELTVREDYGLIRGVEAFLGRLSEPRTERALLLLTAMIEELRSERLDYQLSKAEELRGAMVV